MGQVLITISKDNIEKEAAATAVATVKDKLKGVAEVKIKARYTEVVE